MKGVALNPYPMAASVVLPVVSRQEIDIFRLSELQLQALPAKLIGLAGAWDPTCRGLMRIRKPKIKRQMDIQLSWAFSISIISLIIHGLFIGVLNGRIGPGQTEIRADRS